MHVVAKLLGKEQPSIQHNTWSMIGICVNISVKLQE